jgi:pimeloyl-ACP methyl ester carboxylesterase
MAPQTAEEQTSLAAQLLDEFFPFASPMDALPDPTPAEGPDPYGNPDPEWLRIDWREYLHRIDVGGARDVNYVEMGPDSGEALLLVHGLSGSWQNWLENIPYFARDHRVTALDLPGFGDSPMPEWEISVEAYGRFALDFCEALGINRCTIVGNSMGGFIAAETATQEPGRFEKLVLVSAAGISHARMRRQPAEVAARMGIATAPLTFRLFDRRALLRAHPPEDGASLGVLSARKRQARRAAGRSRPVRIRHPRPARGRRRSHPDRLGAERSHRSAERRDRLRPAPPQLEHGHLRQDRPPADG